MLARALAACTLAATAAAQVVDPPVHEWLPAARATGFPFGYPDRQVVRHLEVHDALAGASRVVSAIALRRAAGDTTPAPAFTAVVSMRLSTATTTAATIDAAFDANHGPDATVALPQRTVSLPATDAPAGALAAFTFAIPADAPFVFGGGGPLCVELRVASHTNAVPLTFALAAEDPSPRTASFGAACNGLALTTRLDGAAAIHTVTGADPGAPVALAFGGDAFAPVDLAFLGAPGCAWQVDAFATATGVADYLSSWELTVPLGAAPPGAFYVCQAASPVVSRTLPPPPQTLRATGVSLLQASSARVAGRVWAESLTAATGLRQPVFGLVIEVR